MKIWLTIMEVIYKELESDKHWPQVELPAFLTRSPSSLHFLLASKAEATQGGESSGIQRPQVWTSTFLQLAVGLTAHSLPFLGWKSVLWGRKDSTVKGLDHSACLSTEAVIIQLFWVNLGKKETAESLVCIACLPLWILLYTDIYQGSEKWSHVQSIIGCMTCAVTQSPRLIRSPRLLQFSAVTILERFSA